MDDNSSKVTLSSRDSGVYYGTTKKDCTVSNECHHDDHHCHPKCSPCGNQEYILSDSINVHLEPGKEVNKDIVLAPNRAKDCGTISGFVKDKDGHPIENALVKIFDGNHHPVAHVFTNHEGQFLICLAPGNYIVKAVR
ncbi:carboxypeptidase-like regulatory domain-containing protein [Desulfitobacterium metallireducens]|uniref:Carboxypeptidase regulatory-like domain-containing protein n=1 Tax=Desulfitobacterium metallireducens DSM 15288 TaxID=871968 RepID=W0EHA1_9FIRM|nr:carboxypeptidase-like regulatory domain-containing protein [Desulfitobacterium metallireducens]AHF08446.1 hypothetical protein DESME_03020 [Desulfitobacterium metallireducens DSM 15288]